jgi:hypothetical protein
MFSIIELQLKIYKRTIGKLSLRHFVEMMLFTFESQFEQEFTSQMNSLLNKVETYPGRISTTFEWNTFQQIFAIFGLDQKLERQLNDILLEELKPTKTTASKTPVVAPVSKPVVTPVGKKAVEKKAPVVEKKAQKPKTQQPKPQPQQPVYQQQQQPVYQQQQQPVYYYPHPQVQVYSNQPITMNPYQPQPFTPMYFPQQPIQQWYSCQTTTVSDDEEEEDEECYE